MVTFGYVKNFRVEEDGAWTLQVRIPSVHGPYDLTAYRGYTIRNYTQDSDLPWYQSLMLQREPKDGDIVALESINHANTDFLVIGLTGGRYYSQEKGDTA
jgi:hypothetical protein